MSMHTYAHSVPCALIRNKTKYMTISVLHVQELNNIKIVRDAGSGQRSAKKYNISKKVYSAAWNLSVSEIKAEMEVRS